ncbi:hypothetical protein M422DRAFT_277403 [Sphaerobolus stellatus SS14]|uniref:Chitin synthase export chaperone n=1 Tax=Sphaerobolus stellatus (strain SS14) TaxID=990650 RepID=A0A0C9T0L5_SPHS4|nr:hypothetical protein M422DRAFT_277403 [Sphaerobolus stellatus SS14]
MAFRFVYLEEGSLAIAAILILVTIFQLALAIRWQFRFATGHRLPSIFAITAQILLLLDYIFWILSFSARRTSWGDHLLTKSYVQSKHFAHYGPTHSSSSPLSSSSETDTSHTTHHY